MAKTKKKVGTEDNPTAAQETATRPEETEEKSGQEGGADAEGREDTGMDPRSETPPAGGEGLSDREKAFLREVVKSAKKVFASHDVERLWFTADGSGFGNEADASAHADTLVSKALFEIDRKDLLN